jgi:hypothetical protein
VTTDSTPAERQRSRRARFRAAGACLDCGAEVFCSTTKCRKHLLANRIASRKSKGSSPYDSTIWRGGRPPVEASRLHKEPEV